MLSVIFTVAYYTALFSCIAYFRRRSRQYNFTEKFIVVYAYVLFFTAPIAIYLIRKKHSRFSGDDKRARAASFDLGAQLKYNPIVIAPAIVLAAVMPLLLAYSAARCMSELVAIGAVSRQASPRVGKVTGFSEKPRRDGNTYCLIATFVEQERERTYTDHLCAADRAYEVGQSIDVRPGLGSGKYYLGPLSRYRTQSALMLTVLLITLWTMFGAVAYVLVRRWTIFL